MSLISNLFDEQFSPLVSEITSRMGQVESLLREAVQVDDLVVDEATSHLAKAGGKRLRPALCLLTAQL